MVKHWSIARKIYIRLLLSIFVIMCLSLVTKAIENEDTFPSKQSWYKGLSNIWMVRLMLNLIGYASIFIPAAILVRYLKKIKYNERAGSGPVSSIIKLCVFGLEQIKPSLEEGSSAANTPPQEKTVWQMTVTLIICFIGLQVSFLTWGVLQERIMKYDYGATDTQSGEKFRNSQFLVFINRILAFILSSSVVIFTRQPRHTAPLYKYSYCSFSNIMSSWFQYEALKFVSFPAQVLGKACKIIPVMLMGKVVSRKSYHYYEYVTAAMISLGVSLFLLSRGEGNKQWSTATSFSGVILMVGYMLFDSFTSNWQGALFTTHKMSSVQMMMGVNLFSVLFTSVSLVEQGTMFSSLEFMFKYPQFMYHALLLSLCSATGQLFIYYCISQFGAVTFTIIMTIRQGLAILLSCIIYHHSVAQVGLLGILVVFTALFARIYFGKKSKSAKTNLKGLVKTEQSQSLLGNGKA